MTTLSAYTPIDPKLVRRQPALDVYDRDLRSFVGTTAALARLTQAATANKDSGRFSRLKNIAKIQPFLVDTAEPFVSLGMKPLVEVALRFTTVSSECRLLTLAIITAIIGACVFGHKIKDNGWFIPIILLAATALPLFIEKCLVSIPTASHIKRLNMAQRAILNLANKCENYDFLIKAASMALILIMAHQKYQNPSDLINTSFPQTAIICTAAFMLMPQLSSKLLKDVEAGVMRPIANLLKAYSATSELANSENPLSCLADILQNERGNLLTILPFEIKEQYLYVISLEAIYKKEGEPRFRAERKKIEDKLNAAKAKYDLEQKKPLSSYKTILTFTAQDTALLEQKKAEALLQLAGPIASYEKDLSNLESNFRTIKQQIEQANQKLISLIEASKYPQDIKAVVEDLKASGSWHHLIIKNCKTFATRTTFVQTASDAFVFSARAAQIITQGNPHSLIHTGASAVVQGADRYTETKQRLLSNGRNILIATAAKGGSMLIAPHASKFFLNFVAPYLIQQIASNFNSNWSFAVTQVASFYGWLAFISLISGLQDVYSSSNIAASNALPVRALAANAVEFLATRPQTMNELLTNAPTQARIANQTFDQLLTTIQDPNFSIFTSHADILKGLKTLGIVTRTLPLKMQKTFENFETPIGLALNALKPIFHHQREQTAQQEPPLLLEDAPVEHQGPPRLIRSSSSATQYALSMLFLHGKPGFGTLAKGIADNRGIGLLRDEREEEKYFG